jgi:hypothetical protein
MMPTTKTKKVIIISGHAIRLPTEKRNCRLGSRESLLVLSRFTMVTKWRRFRGKVLGGVSSRRRRRRRFNLDRKAPVIG